MTTLLELSAEARDLAQRLMAVEEARRDAETDEAQEALAQAEVELEALLVQVGEDITNKADAYCDVIAEFNARADVMKAQELTYRRKREVAERAAKRLKERLQAVLEGLGMMKVAGTRWTLTLQASPPSVIVTDEAQAVACGFGEIVQEVRVDRKAILAAWKENAGSIAAFADVARGTHLRIR